MIDLTEAFTHLAVVYPQEGMGVGRDLSFGGPGNPHGPTLHLISDEFSHRRSLYFAGASAALVACYAWMGRLLGVLSFCLILSQMALAASPQHFFPNRSLGETIEQDTFTQNWYSTQLTALQERPLCCGFARKPVTIRFTWLRTFHHPVAIRLERSEHGGGWTLTTKEACGAGGYDPGRLIHHHLVKLRESDVTSVLTEIRFGSEYWSLPSREPPDTPEDGTIIVRNDGAQWILEVVDGHAYHFVDRWSPHSGIVRDVGLSLMALADQDFGPVY